MIKELFYNLITLFQQTQKGWIPDEEDLRDYKFADYFGEDIFGAVIPEEFSWEDSQLPQISNQGKTLSCVSNAFSFVNAFHSKQEGNDVFLSWRYLYANVPHISGGTRVRDNCDWLRKQGQCLNVYMPEKNWAYAFNRWRERARITDLMRENANIYKIKGNFTVNARNKIEMKTAIMKAPLPIGVYSNNSAWARDIIRYDGRRQFGHYTAIIGWAKTHWIIVDWKGKGTKRKLDIKHPIASAKAILDIPDAVLSSKIMWQTVKTKNDPKIWAINGAGEKYHIANWEQYEEGVRTKMFHTMVEKTQEYIDKFPVTENPPVFIK